MVTLSWEESQNEPGNYGWTKFFKIKAPDSKCTLTGTRDWPIDLNVMTWETQTVETWKR